VQVCIKVRILSLVTLGAFVKFGNFECVFQKLHYFNQLNLHYCKIVSFTYLPPHNTATNTANLTISILRVRTRVVHVKAAAGICAVVPQEAVEAAIWEHDCRQQWDRRGRGGEVGNTMGSDCFMTTATMTNMMATTKASMRRMGRGCVEEQTTGENPTTTVATSSAVRPLGAWGGGP
jgi:hypothetical protein